MISVTCLRFDFCRPLYAIIYLHMSWKVVAWVSIRRASFCWEAYRKIKRIQDNKAHSSLDTYSQWCWQSKTHHSRVLSSHPMAENPSEKFYSPNQALLTSPSLGWCINLPRDIHYVCLQLHIRKVGLVCYSLTLRPGILDKLAPRPDNKIKAMKAKTDGYWLVSEGKKTWQWAMVNRLWYTTNLHALDSHYVSDRVVYRAQSHATTL